MKIFKTIFIFIIFLVLYSCSFDRKEINYFNLKGLETAPVIRVGLSKFFPANELQLSVMGYFTVKPNASENVIMSYNHLSDCTVKSVVQGIQIAGNILYCSDIVIHPATDGILKINEIFYRGEVRIIKKDDKLFVVNMLDLEKYKSRQHAVRSLNNVLKILLQENLVEREKRDKTFIYRLSPRIKTLVVKS